MADKDTNNIIQAYNELLAVVTRNGRAGLTIKHSILLKLIGLTIYDKEENIIKEVTTLLAELRTNRNYIEIHDDTLSSIIGTLQECVLIDKNQRARPAFILRDISLLLSTRPVDCEFLPEMSVLEKLFKLNPAVIRSCLFGISRPKTTTQVVEIYTTSELNKYLGDSDFALFTNVGCFTCYQDINEQIHINCVHKDKSEDFIEDIEPSYFYDILGSFVVDDESDEI